MCYYPALPVTDPRTHLYPVIWHRTSSPPLGPWSSTLTAFNYQPARPDALSITPYPYKGSTLIHTQIIWKHHFEGGCSENLDGPKRCNSLCVSWWRFWHIYLLSSKWSPRISNERSVQVIDFQHDSQGPCLWRTSERERRLYLDPARSQKNTNECRLYKNNIHRVNFSDRFCRLELVLDFLHWLRL